MGNYRTTPDTTKHTIFGSSNRFTYAASGMCGWRLTMQDAHLCLPEFTDRHFGLFAVFDGHGGEEVAKFVQIHFARILQNSERFKNGEYEQALVEAFIKVDERMATPQGISEVRSYQSKDRLTEDFSEECHAGCTAIVCLITQNDVYVANAGDSRCIAISPSGVVTNLSTDHKPDDQPQYTRIKKAGGRVQNGRVNGNLNLSRALGDLQYKSNKQLKLEQQMISPKPDVTRMKLQQVSMVVLGCDGVWERMTNEEVGRFVFERRGEEGIEGGNGKQGEDLGGVVEKCLDLLLAPDCQEENGLDNMTMIAVSVRKPG